MFRAMAWKEFRETAWIALAAVIVYAVLATVGYAAWGPETWISYRPVGEVCTICR